MLNRTISDDQVRLAVYYERGMVDGIPGRPTFDRSAELAAHAEAWLDGTAAPDLNRLADWSLASETAMSVIAIERELLRPYNLAVDAAERQDRDASLSAEARALHGLPEPAEAPEPLRGLSAGALHARRDAVLQQWEHAVAAADERAAADPNAPLGVVRRDLHPAVALGLGISPSRRLSKDEIQALMVGRRADGQPIEGKTYATRRRLPIDPKTGEIHYAEPLGSLSISASADKSVSVAWAFASPAQQALIYHAHLEASRDAFGMIAGEIGKVRRGEGGRDTPIAAEVAWLEFTHHTSRRTSFGVDERGNLTITPDRTSPGDPELHTHAIYPNATFDVETGKVGSLDTAAMRGLQFTAGAYYQARLAQNLREAGFAVDLDPATGAARMPAIPDHVREMFSKRTRAGEMLARKTAADRGEDWEALSPDDRAARMKQATQSPVLTMENQAKGLKDDLADTADWKRQATAIGWAVPTSFEMFGPLVPELSREQKLERAYEVSLPMLADKLEHDAVISHHYVRTMATRGLIDAGITDRSDIDGVTKLMREHGVMQYGERTALQWGIEPDRRVVSITTTLHERQEQEFIALARTAAADRSATIPADLLREKIAASKLDFTGEHGRAQRAAIERLGAGGRFGLSLGAAGSGKTAMLTVLTAAWHEQGREVYGASLAWRQADALTDAGIPANRSKAFSVLLDGIRDGSVKLGPHSVVAVDEWGLIGTRQALQLMRAQQAHGFSIVALGDDRQAASVSAGAIIDLSRRALGAEQVPEILTTVRQQTERERAIVGLFREGRAAEALAMKREDGTAELVYGGYAGVIERVAELYADRVELTGEAPTVSTPTNTDAHRISEAIRTERRARGWLGPELGTIRATDGERDYSLTLAQGDKVRLFSSTVATGETWRGKIGRNGSVLDVVDLNDQGLKVRDRAGRVATIEWDRLASRQRGGRVQLAYGDAMTIHTAQGSTGEGAHFRLAGGQSGGGWQAGVFGEHAAPAAGVAVDVGGGGACERQGEASDQ